MLSGAITTWRDELKLWSIILVLKIVLSFDALENEAYHIFIMFQTPKYQVGNIFIHGRKYMSAWGEWETK